MPAQDFELGKKGIVYLCSREQCRTFDFMEMMIFILAYSRVKPKKQGIVPFRAIAMN